MRIYLHPVLLRAWHWINALIVILLIVTGLYLRMRGIAAIQPHDPVLLWHKYLGLGMIATTLFWLVYRLTTENNRRHYMISRKDLKGIFVQGRYYFFSIFTGEENPFHASDSDKYNPLQKIAYGAVMLIFLPIQTLTGLCFMDIPILRPYLLQGSLIGLLGAVHALLAYLMVLFLIVHLYMTTFGDTVFSHTKAMITGYEERAQRVDEYKTGGIGS